MLDAAAFRAEFPVLESLSHLNAGTEGPMPRRAAEALRERIDAELNQGRGSHAHMMDVLELAGRLREGYASVLGAAPEDVALTGSTTDGINTVLSALELGPRDEVVTSDQEHPGLLAPLGLARTRRGVDVRVVPFADLESAVRPSTTLIACSHVSWVDGRIADIDALTATGVPLLLDGAQALGAIPVDVHALGCDYYAGPGQKWLCGPEGSGALYVRRERLGELCIPWPSYGSVADAAHALELVPAEGARRFDGGFPSGLRSVWALASLAVLGDAGWDGVHTRAAALAASLAADLAARGLGVAPRGASTLVSWSAVDAESEVERLRAAGFVVRSIPAFGLVRASVGAWCSEEELARLAELAA
jgi:selenocysteine lyase/cysteine desulfurase